MNSFRLGCMNNLDLDEAELEEFKIESAEILDEGENSLLAIDRGESFTEHYDAIFRLFHSLKGAAGMLGIDPLQSLMHNLENSLTITKDVGGMQKDQITFFLDGIDIARQLLDNREPDKTIGEFPSGGGESQTSNEALDQAQTPNEVPAEQSTDSATQEQATKSSVEDSLGLIYIVDDEETILSILHDEIEGAGFSVQSFLRPADLLTAIGSKKPDVILSDIKMPEMTGLELLSKIQALDPDLPLILLSAYVDTPDLLDAIQHGVFSVVQKPFEPPEIIHQLKIAAQRNQTTKLLNRTIDLFMFQFPELDEFLRSQGKEDMGNSIRHDLMLILEQRRKLKTIKKSI